MTRLGFVFLVISPLAIAEITVRPALVYSKGFGGLGSDNGAAAATDKEGNVYVTGTTSSRDFPVKNGFQRKIGGAFLRASTDSGKTWSSPEISGPVYAAAISPKSPGVIYIGTSSGLYKSTDALKSFSALNTGFRVGAINALAVDAENPALVYAATSYGFYRSRDAGESWLRMEIEGQMLALTANSSGLYLLNYEGNIFKSTDTGTTWSQLTNAPARAYSLASEPSHPNVVYAGVPEFQTAGIYKTNDGGVTWIKLLDTPFPASTFALATSPTTVYAATYKGVLRSRDGGDTWTATNITARATNVAVDPNNPQVAYADAEGIWMTADGGATWTNALPVRQWVQTIAVLPTSPATVIVGAESAVNVFVTKWSADGTQMLYSTYLGGSLNDYATAIAVDRQGNAYVTGYTVSSDFPVTRSALQTKNAGAVNSFVAKIGPDGGTLAYSTYLGGLKDDKARAIALDSNGNAYVTGQATSANFPVTVNAAQSQLRQGCTTAPANMGDAFVAKINPDGTSLSYSTFLGGSCMEDGSGIAVDGSGNAWVVGRTTSPDFPVQKGALEPSIGGGGIKGFLAKLSPQGNNISYATFLGNVGDTVATAVALDAKGNVYVAGATFGFDKVLFQFDGPQIGLCAAYLPAISSGLSCGEPDLGTAYVLKFDPSGSSRTYLKYIGNGFNFATPHAIAVDAAGRAWITGGLYGSSYDPKIARFPTLHPFQTFGNGFISEISADGGTLLFSSRMESAAGIALDSNGNAFVAGSTTALGESKFSISSALLVRVDGAISSAVTVEQPRTFASKLYYPSYAEGVIAPGEIVVLDGSGLGPLQEIGAQLTSQGKVATTLGGTTVSFDGVPAPILSVQDKRLVCVVPFSIGSKARYSSMQVENNGAKSNAILLVPNQVAIEVLAVVNQDGVTNSAAKPAAPNSVITIYASGMGQTDPLSVDGEINASPKRLSIEFNTAAFGDRAAEVLYVGSAPGQVAGVSQINLRVPDLPPGQYPIYLGDISTETSSFEINPVYLSVGAR